MALTPPIGATSFSADQKVETVKIHTRRRILLPKETKKHQAQPNWKPFETRNQRFGILDKREELSKRDTVMTKQKYDFD